MPETLVGREWKRKRHRKETLVGREVKESAREREMLVGRESKESAKRDPSWYWMFIESN